MSRTHRSIPENKMGLRRPHTLGEIKQITGILADDRVYNTHVAGLNHMRKRCAELPTAWDDVLATSIYQEDHAV
jgi:hypothetical protein